jgi:hypothetical protein
MDPGNKCRGDICALAQAVSLAPTSPLFRAEQTLPAPSGKFQQYERWLKMGFTINSNCRG